MPFPEGPPPRDEFGAFNQPRTLNRWLDVNPVHRLTRTRRYLTIPAFSVDIDYLGYSDIVAAFNYEADKNFTLKAFDAPVDPNYCLCVMWKEDDVTYRYALWNDVGEVFYFPVPLYDGQLIKKNFRFEVWSIAPTSNLTIEINAAGRAASNGTYTQVLSTLWNGPTDDLDNITLTDWRILNGPSIKYTQTLRDSNFPFGIWVTSAGTNPAPYTSVGMTCNQATDLIFYTSVLGNQDYMFASDSTLASVDGGIVTDFNNAFPTFPFNWPTDSSPTTN